MKSIKILIIFLALWLILLLITFNRHIRRIPNTYNSEIWADKAGYYVFLPATFIYQWQGTQMPDSIHLKTGKGFDIIENNIVTKYPMGVAIMLLPFWVINHYFIADPSDGFSFSYTLISSVASTFYVLAGLFISYFCMRKFASRARSILLTLFLFLSTNLLYYTIIETGMSHSFSFFWFSLLLYIILKIKNQQKTETSDAIILGLTLGAIILIRPINCIFCFPYFMILFIHSSDYKQTFIQLFLSTKSLYICIIPLLLFAPQLYYYSYTSGISPAYSGEGFIYLSNPKIAEVLFSPNNGLFLYTPIVCFLMLFYLFNIKNYAKTLIPIILLFVLIVFVYGSWWSYELGCAFGHRSMVEFYSFLFLPLAIIDMPKKIKNTAIFIGILCFIYSLKLILSYDGCFYGNNDWDWNAYITLLVSNIK
jgi:hypothetical protein